MLCPVAQAASTCCDCLFPNSAQIGADGHAKIHDNGIFGQDDMIVPPVIDRNRRLFEKFMGEVHSHTDCILSVLSNALNLPHDLKDYYRKNKPSAANMAMLRYLIWGSSEKRIGNMARIDIGTLTVVFSKSDGLQAMLPGDDRWSFLSPRAGHAAVNVGRVSVSLSAPHPVRGHAEFLSVHIPHLQTERVSETQLRLST